MKLIFLDIDGVMNYSGGKHVLSECIHFIEDDKLLLLKEIVDATGAYLVLSSTWRYGWRDIEVGCSTSIFAESYYKLRDKFHDYGLAFFSKTPILKGFSREMEIRYWMSNCEDEFIESFVILDDEEEDFEVLKGHLVTTKSEEGLQEEQAQKAIEILQRPVEEDI